MLSCCVSLDLEYVYILHLSVNMFNKMRKLPGMIALLFTWAKKKFLV